MGECLPIREALATAHHLPSRGNLISDLAYHRPQNILARQLCRHRRMTSPPPTAHARTGLFPRECPSPSPSSAHPEDVKSGPYATGVPAAETPAPPEDIKPELLCYRSACCTVTRTLAFANRATATTVCCTGWFDHRPRSDAKRGRDSSPESARYNISPCVGGHFKGRFRPVLSEQLTLAASRTLLLNIGCLTNAAFDTGPRFLLLRVYYLLFFIIVPGLRRVVIYYATAVFVICTCDDLRFLLCGLASRGKLITFHLHLLDCSAPGVCHKGNRPFLIHPSCGSI